MLIPRYSLRWLLGLMTFSAGVSLILAYAVRGQAWAIGVTSALWSLAVVGLFYVGAFLVAWLIAQALNARRGGLPTAAGGSPFAAAKPGGLPVGAAATAPMRPADDTPPAMTG